jgi:hypothetical protein
MSGAWAVATPLGGSPDEPAHIIKAASVVRGQLIGNPTRAQAVTSVRVPVDLADASRWPCYAFNANVEPNCEKPLQNGSGLRTATTSAGLYNPLYYLLVGWPSLLTGRPWLSVIAMRLVSAVISCFFLAGAFCGLMMFRRALISGIGFLAAVTPMVFFLNGAVNPNSLEIAAGSALLTTLLVLVRGPAVRHWYLVLGFVVLSGVLLANARGISPLWMGLIGAIVVVAAAPGRLATLLARVSVWATLAILAIGVGFAGWWILHTDTLERMGSYPGAGQTTPLAGFETMILLRSFDPGLIGTFGWLDTPAPEFVYALWSFLAFAVVGACFVVCRGRLLWSVLVAVGGFMILPAAVQAASVERSGYIWQGRYSLVVYAAVILSGTVAAARSLPNSLRLPGRWATRLFWILTAAVALGQGFALLDTTRRYAVGEAGTYTSFFLHPVWTPPGGVFIWPIVLLVGFALVVVVWTAWLRARPDEVSIETQRAIRTLRNA